MNSSSDITLSKWGRSDVLYQLCFVDQLFCSWVVRLALFRPHTKLKACNSFQFVATHRLATDVHGQGLGWHV